MPKRSVFHRWWEQCKSSLLSEPHSFKEVVSLIRIAADKKLFDKDTSHMIEGVLAISKMQVRDIMIPRAQMVVLEHGVPHAELLKTIAQASHSRFPVVDEGKDNVIGVLLVKDFIKTYFYEGQSQVDLTTIVRPAFFVPESKRLDSLLNEFKANHSHLAVVVDEYGGIAGLITIEDILEEIVGDIEDEFDHDELQIQSLSPDVHHVKATMSLEALNQALGTQFSDEAVDTIGGLLSLHLGHIPKAGESMQVQDWSIKVLKSDSRRALQIELKRQNVSDA
jgi:magnesium and cobalt transporter